MEWLELTEYVAGQIHGRQIRYDKDDATIGLFSCWEKGKPKWTVELNGPQPPDFKKVLDFAGKDAAVKSSKSCPSSAEWPKGGQVGGFSVKFRQ